MSAFDRQEGGDHYKSMAIQPVQYILANGIGFIEGSVIKYVSRWQKKGGVADLKKARHFLDQLIEETEKEQAFVDATLKDDAGCPRQEQRGRTITKDMLRQFKEKGE